MGEWLSGEVELECVCGRVRETVSVRGELMTV